MDIRSFILPPNWDEEKRRIYETYGKVAFMEKWWGR